MADELLSAGQDNDPVETQEWLDALASTLRNEGPGRTQYLLNQLVTQARLADSTIQVGLTTPYVNTIPVELEQKFPDDGGMTRRVTAMIRWNAIAMVLRAGKQHSDLGGHLATYASGGTLYEVGFNHFFHAPTAQHGGDLLYIQGHSSPGIYARAYLEGRITADQLDHFRQEVDGKGLSSYPHPWLMPEFWQFPTVSMGLGAIQGIYQARFLKYLENRDLAKADGRKVWVFCGDGEMDEPESLGALSVAGREHLDNLIFVINCNLQRLDGPVRGNSKIIQELEGMFRGAGWNVIKVIWGNRWDRLFAQDKKGLLLKRLNECVDGDFQNYEVKGGAYVREHFFGKYPELKALVADLTDEEITHLNNGGHDRTKVFTAYSAAVKHKGQPTVILAKTVKGYGMGLAGEALNITHQQKKMSLEDLKIFRDRFHVPLSDEQVERLEFCHPDPNSPEIKYMHERRAALGGSLPARHVSKERLPVPALNAFAALLEGTAEREISTTMAFVRILNILLKDKQLSKLIIPIVPDECRTFGMEGLFRQIGIYSPVGQLYEPVDKDQVMYYREAKNGQLLEEGITEAGAFATWMAAATSYATNNLPLIPFFIFYSMFGFQRIGDLAWAAADMRSRGFLLGATSGRTTLAGEGLQHDDGQSHILSSIVPNCISYDPTYAYELAVIIQDGMRRMYQDLEDVYYYVTVMNENYAHPAMPAGAEAGILKGMYLLQQTAPKAKIRLQLLGSGAILREVIAAAEILQNEYGIGADIWSVTSFTELRRDGLAIDRHNRLHPGETAKQSYVTTCLQGQPGPVIAATDYMKLFADQIRAYVPQKYYVLGTDGFGRSDTRTKLRYFFEVNAQAIAYTALKALADEGKVPTAEVINAMTKLNIDPTKPDPVMV